MRKWYPWIVVGVTIGFTAAVWNRLPERLPTHWNAEGEVDGWSSRTTAAWMMPAILVITALVLPWLPRIDPRRANYEKFRSTYDIAIAGILSMMAVIHMAVLGAALGWPIRIERAVPVLIGALFVLIGNMMPRARSNWLFGIRTPWTLSNDRVWERTHRLGGILFVACGIVLMLVAFAPRQAVVPMLVAGTTVASIVPLAYSYFAWKQETSR